MVEHLLRARAGRGEFVSEVCEVDEKTQQVLRSYRVRNERRLYELVGKIACKRAGVREPGPMEPMPVKAAELVAGVMKEMTSYRTRDGRFVPGVLRPELLRSDERLEKSVEDAEAWLAHLEENHEATD